MAAHDDRAERCPRRSIDDMQAGGASTRPPVGSPPPGWYADPYGVSRWWDGSQWGPAAYPPARPNTALGVISHLGALVGGVVLPLVIYLVAKDDAFGRENARRALNFQITFMVVWIGGIFLAMVLATAVHPSIFAVLFGLLFVAMILNYVWSIIAAVRASRGEVWRYPVSIGFVGGG
jgi:uncharacterized Tic20 family protein